VEQLGAGSGTEGVEAFSKSASRSSGRTTLRLLVTREVPVEDVHAAVSTQRVGYAIVRARDEPIERHGHVDDDVGHGKPPFS
jgi:hypothetical protein